MAEHGRRTGRGATGVPAHGELRVPQLRGWAFLEFMRLQRRLSTGGYKGKPRAQCDFCGRPIKHGDQAFIEKVRRGGVLVLTACSGCPELIRDPLVVIRA